MSFLPPHTQRETMESDGPGQRIYYTLAGTLWQLAEQIWHGASPKDYGPWRCIGGNTLEEAERAKCTCFRLLPVSLLFLCILCCPLLLLLSAKQTQLNVKWLFYLCVPFTHSLSLTIARLVYYRDDGLSSGRSGLQRISACQHLLSAATSSSIFLLFFVFAVGL